MQSNPGEFTMHDLRFGIRLTPGPVFVRNTGAAGENIRHDSGLLCPETRGQAGQRHHHGGDICAVDIARGGNV